MWAKIKEWCKGSETIVIARAKLLIGTAFMVVSQMPDPTPVFALLHISPSWLPIWQIASAYLMADGVMCEWARRHNATDLH